MGIPMARIEFVDEMMAKGFNLMEPEANLPEKPQLFLEFHGSEESVKEQAELFGEIVADMGGGHFKWTTKAEERTALWKLRHNAVGHVGDGNFHCGILVGDENERERADKFCHELTEMALELDGTVSGEHGIGRGKMKYMAAEHGDALMLMGDIKRSFDPQNIMNPGKMIPVN